MNFEAFFYQTIAELRRALPRAGAGKKRPRAIRMPGDFVDKRREPQYRAGPVIRYYISAGVSSEEAPLKTQEVQANASEARPEPAERGKDLP